MLNEKLIELRKRSGLTQADLAKYLRITGQAHSCYESNKREMDFTSLRLFSDFYNVTTDYLLGRKNLIKDTFSNEENEIILRYRSLDGRGKESVKATLSYKLLYVTKK